MSKTITLYSHSERETQEIGKKIAHMARKGDCFALYGTLGMGKSVLARAFVQELLSTTDEVPSPTFTLVQMYDADDFTIYHFDLYRLKSPEEIFELGMEEALYEGVSLIEWPEKMGGYLPKKAICIQISPEKDSRKIEITTSSEEGMKRIEESFL